LRYDRVLMDDIEKRAEPVNVKKLARQSGGKIEAKTVDVHLRDPIAQAVHDQLEHPRMGHVEGVTAAGIVHVKAAVVLHQTIVGSVVDTTETQGRAELITLA